MSEWPRVQIRKLAKLGTGHTPSRSVEEYWTECSIPWLTLADVGPLRSGTVQVVDDTKEMISPLGLANSAAVVHPAGTVALSRTASVGYSCIMGSDMATSQDYVTWTCGPLLDNRFLLWVLRGERERIIGRMTGSTHKTIYMPDIEELDTPLPPLAEQRAIADYLDAETARIDDLIAKKQQLVHLLEERRRAEAETLLTGDSPRLVEMRRLLTEMPQYGAAESGVAMAEGLLRYIRITDIGEDGSLLADGAKGLPVETGSDYRLVHNDLLFARSGATSGKSFLYHVSDGPSCFAGYLIKVRVNERMMLPRLVWHWTSTDHYWRQIRGAAVQATIENVSAERYKELLVPVPPLEHQARLLARLDAQLAHARRAAAMLSQQVELLAEHRQALITAAVTGEFAVPGAA